MKKIGLFYNFDSKKTSIIAGQIQDEFNGEAIEPVNASSVTEEQFLSYDNLILGVPTWFDGELPTYWDEFGPAIEDMDLKGKSFALYGLGDQVEYPENFLDAVGIMAHLLESRGALIIGHTSTDGYHFEKSKAIRDGKFSGLAVDFENQGTHIKEQVRKWVKQLRSEFQ
jgi:flavodoxin I